MRTKCKPKISYYQKRKPLEAGCSEQNKTLPKKQETAKRIKMNTSSSNGTYLLNSQFIIHIILYDIFNN